MQRSKRLSFTILIGVAVEILNKIVPLFILSYVQKRLGVSAFGSAQFSIAIIEMVIPMVTFGYYHFGLVELSRKPSEQMIGHLIANLSALKVIHAICVFIGLSFFAANFEAYSPYFWLLISASFALFFTGIDTVWLFIGTQKMALVSLLSGLGRFLSLILIVLLVDNSEDQLKFVAFYFLANAFVSAVTAGLSYRRYKPPLPDLPSMRSIFIKARHFALVPIMIVFIDRIDMLVVESVFGADGAGLYAGPLRLSHSLFQVLIAISTAFLSEVIAINDRKVFTKHIHAAIWILCAVLVPMIAGIWFVGGDFLSLIFDESYRSVELVLSFMICGLALNSAIGVFGQQVLLLRGDERFFSLCLITMGLGIIIFSVLCSSAYGITGVAIGMLAGKCLGVLCIAVRAMRYLDSFPWRLILLSVFPGIIMYTTLLFADLEGLIYKLGVGAIVYMVCFFTFNYQQIRNFSSK